MLENDYMYLSSALISASARILNNNDLNYREKVIFSKNPKLI